jgi:hypothetical protein
MERIRPDTHKQTTRPRTSTPTFRKPFWFGDIGEPCGSCCIKMWWRDFKDYNDCTIVFPNKTEYGFFCIDYTSSFVKRINTLSEFSIKQWPPFVLAKKAAARRKLKTTFYDPETITNVSILPLRSFKREHLPPRSRQADGETLCQQYFEYLQKLSDTVIGGEFRTFGVDSYVWNPDINCKRDFVGGMPNIELDCIYPCLLPKLFDGNDCVCAEGLQLVDDKCVCSESDNKSIFVPNKNLEVPNTFVYPIGKCECKEKNSNNILTMLDPNSDCKDCECIDSEIANTFQDTLYWWRKSRLSLTIPSIWNDDTEKCECDSSKGLIEVAREIRNNRPRLICKCENPNYIWDAKKEECVLKDNYVDWGTIEISRKFYKTAKVLAGNTPLESDLLEKIICPEQFSYVKYEITFTVENLNNFDGADLELNFKFVGDVTQELKSYEIRSLFQNDQLVVNRLNKTPDKINFPNNISFIPRRVTIGKHNKNNINNFININRQYVVKYIIITQIISTVSNESEIAIEAGFSDLDAYKIDSKNNNRIIIIPKLNKKNIGPTRNTVINKYKHDPDNCDNNEIDDSDNNEIDDSDNNEIDDSDFDCYCEYIIAQPNVGEVTKNIIQQICTECNGTFSFQPMEEEGLFTAECVTTVNNLDCDPNFCEGITGCGSPSENVLP